MFRSNVVMHIFNHNILFFKDYLVILVYGILLASAVKFFIKNKRFLELAVKLPGPPAYPIIGNALKFACKTDQILERVVEILESYGDATPMRLWMGPELYVAITEPRDIEIILNSKQATNKGRVYKFFHNFIGDGLISGSGKTWKTHRKMILHIITQRALDLFVETFDRRSKELVEKLKYLATGEIFDVFNYIEGCTIDITCETIMGNIDINALNNANHEFIYSTEQMYKIVYDRMMKIWLHPDWIFRMTSHYSRQESAKNVISAFTKGCVEACIKNMREGKSDTSILHKLLVANDKMHELSDEELRDEIYTIYLASQDTMAVTSSFAVLMLAIHEEAQNKARAEINDVLGDSEITTDSLSKLKYLEMVIKETLRLFPIAPLMVRRLSDELKLEKYVLPKDCHVAIVAFGTHRSPKFWNNPNEFIPERFTVEETSKRHSHAFIPFSGGPMGCIGQKYAFMALKTILANILRNYILQSEVSLGDIKLTTDISIRSASGYKISLKLIKKKQEI